MKIYLFIILSLLTCGLRAEEEVSSLKLRKKFQSHEWFSLCVKSQNLHYSVIERSQSDRAIGVDTFDLPEKKIQKIIDQLVTKGDLKKHIVKVKSRQELSQYLDPNYDSILELVGVLGIYTVHQLISSSLLDKARLRNLEDDNEKYNQIEKKEVVIYWPVVMGEFRK